MYDDFNEIINRLPQFIEAGKAIQETLLANLIMIGEIPAPTFKEGARIEFLQNRFSEYGLHNCSSDEKGNGLGVLPGEDGENNILLVAHADSVHDFSVDHTISIKPGYAKGPGVADNSLGCAVLATLPLILEQLNINIKSNLIFIGSSRSLGRGNIEGLRFFLSNFKKPILVGLNIEGVQQGRLSYSSIGMLRGEITCRVPEEYDWTRFGAVGAIITINEVINKILEIPLPKRPRTTVVMGSIRGGTSFNTIANKAKLLFEIRSESGEIVKDIGQQIEDIAATVSSTTGAEVIVDIFAERRPGGIPFTHLLAKNTRTIMKTLNIKPRISPSTSELAAFINSNIPALTLGITNGENMADEIEAIKIKPIATGIAQIIAILLAIDRGFCNDNK